MVQKSPQELLEDKAAVLARKFADEFLAATRGVLGSARGDLFAPLAESASDTFDRLTPLLFDTSVAGGLLGAAEMLRPLAGGGRGGFPTDPKSIIYPPGEGPVVDFPIVRKSIKAIEAAVTLSPESYYALSAAAKRQAFTVTANLKDSTIEKIRDVLRENVAERQNRAKFEKAIREQLPNVLSDAHIEQVFRNNVNAAYSDGAETALRDPFVVDAFPFRAYYSIHDDRARPEHRRLEKLGLNGTNVFAANDPVWTMFRPPWDFNSFLPDTEVSGRFSLGIKSWYDGMAFEITTESGRRLSVTANHPVLTDQGVVPANAIDNRFYLLGYGGNVASPIGEEVKIDHAPTSIEQAFHSLENLGSRRSTHVRPQDLHGDAAFGNGQIDITGIYRELGYDFNSEFSAGFQDFHFPLGPGLPSSVHLSANGRLVLLDNRPLPCLRFGTSANVNAGIYEAATNCASVNIEEFGDGIFGCPRGVHRNNFYGGDMQSQWHRPQATGLLDRPQFGSGSLEFSGDYRIGHVQFFRQLAERFPGLVTLDKIVDVRQRYFRGHVYDLMSDGGWIVANDLLTVQCRCGFTPLTIRQAARKGVMVAAEWLETGKQPVNLFVPWPDFLPSPSWRRL